MDVAIPCICEGTPHPEGDSVVLRDRLGFLAVQTARNAVLLARASEPDGISAAAVLAILTEQYVLLGVESWSVVDAKGKPLAVSTVALRTRLLEDDEAATIVADAADDLYAERVMLPLLQAASRSSAGTPTKRSTSPTTGSGPSTRKPSSPSSISTIPTVATTTTPRRRAGGSSSSPSSASVA